MAHHAAKAADYDNLLYACATCNAAKGDRAVPDPLTVLIKPAVHIAEDGTIHTESPEAARLIEVLGLDSAASTEFRMLWIGIVALAAAGNPELFRKLLGYPDELPDLVSLRPPGGNTRSEGVRQSCLVRRQSGNLPETY